MTTTPARLSAAYLLAAILLMSAPGCDITVVNELPVASPYRSAHFTIYYSEILFPDNEIVEIAEGMERLLVHVNDYLGTRYDGNMEVFITDTIGISHAWHDERIFITTYYALNDDGHEIAHVVAFDEWGWTPSKFITEGTAEAASQATQGPTDAVDRLTALWKGNLGGMSAADLAVRIRSDILMQGHFEITSFEYDIAAAFMDYLKDRYGIDRVEAWYRSAVANSYLGDHGQTFLDSFGDTLNPVIDDFSAAIFGRL